MKLGCALLLLLLLGATLPNTVPAAEGGWSRIGLRAGVNDATTNQTVHQYELFTSYLLPWGLRSSSGWGLTTKVNGAAGWLHGGGDNGAIVSAGPGIGVEWGSLPIELDAGVNAAFLSRDTFGSRDLNGTVQFISHFGINLRLVRALGVGYNFQHMSNAGMNGSQNPGLNMHMISVMWNFGS